jgi:phi LC3 family holin
MKIDFKKRLQNKPFWIAIFAFIALTGQVFGLYQVPEGWDTWVNTIIMVLIGMGVIIDPTTKGLSD